jgi:hypothetical protein
VHVTSPYICEEITVDGISGFTDPYPFSVNGPQGNTECTPLLDSQMVPEGNNLDEADIKP